VAGAPFFRKALRYVFPDHWSFLLGEVALYSSSSSSRRAST
jgi:ubiquinol-cytochrome c reductase cytochrome b subunit